MTEDSQVADAASGTLLGVVVDMSGSMLESMKNDGREQFSRIENVSRTFAEVVEDAQQLGDAHGIGGRTRLRLFVTGFGFAPEDGRAHQSCYGDVLSVVKGVQEQLEHYAPLQAKVEHVWGEAIEQVLEHHRIPGDARGELCQFVAKELREQVISAAQRRGSARFQRWCASVCERMQAFDWQMRERVARYPKATFLLMPLVVGLLWVLKGPVLLLDVLRRVFEHWLQRKLAQMRDNADAIAAEQAEKVVSKTMEAVEKNRERISLAVEAGITGFIDREAFKCIRLYDGKFSSEKIRRAFDMQALNATYGEVARQVSEIMKPHADFAWKASIALFQAASRALKITPSWAVLKEKTIVCAQQVAWETIAPRVQAQARVIAKQRFTRAVFITISHRTKDRRSSLSLGELSELIHHSRSVQISPKELPVFHGSPLGYALQQTFQRLYEEANLPENCGLRPAILLLSDGMPTDGGVIDAAALAETIKGSGIPIVCCFVTNRNVGRPWRLPQRPGLFWADAADFMFSLASEVDQWPQLRERLRESRFRVKKRSRLFIQINHTEYLQRFIEAMLLPAEQEMKRVPTHQKSRYA